MENPFTFGEAVAPSRLVDRERELNSVIETLRDGARLFLIGPRRFGKTSILKAAKEKATAAGTPTLMVNAEAHLDLDDLAGQLLASAEALFPASPRERALRIVEWFGRFRPEAKYDPISDSFSIGVSPREPGRRNRNIAEALDAIDALAAERGTRIGIIIDEFQEISKREGLPAEKLLRAKVQEHHHLSYVFSGSDTTLMVAMVSQYRRPFYRLGSSLSLGYIPDDDLAHLIGDGFAGAGLQIDDAAIAAIIRLAERVPYNVQRLSAKLFGIQRSRASTELIDGTDVAEALDDILLDERQNYFTYLRSLTSRRQAVLVALADEDTRRLSVSALARRLGLPTSTTRAARKSFIDGDILRLSPVPQREEVIDFVDPFFRVWLARTSEGRLDIE